jgi:hypothetical protein
MYSTRIFAQTRRNSKDAKSHPGRLEVGHIGLFSSWGLLARVLAQDEEENEEAGKSRRLANEAEADVRPHHAKHKRKGQEFKERQSPADHSD